MSIPIDAYTVVIRKATIAAKYPAGMDGYVRDCPNSTFCADEHVCRVSFMQEADAAVFIAELAARGLTPVRNDAAEDVALVSAQHGPDRPCDWLALAEYRGVTIAWLSGTEGGDLFAPAGWSFEHAFQFYDEAAQKNLEFVRTENNIDVYRDRTTGQELYVGRTAQRPDAARHDEMYGQAKALIEGLILLDGKPAPQLGWWNRRRLKRAIRLFEEVVRINPANWAAMWQLGKVCQRLKNFTQGFEWFARAHRLNPDQPDVAREAAIAALDLGRPSDAISYCERAIEIKPQDAGLRANLALALLFSGKPNAARPVAEDALRRTPNDHITARILAIIDEVLDGQRPCPHHARDLSRRR